MKHQFEVYESADYLTIVGCKGENEGRGWRLSVPDDLGSAGRGAEVVLEALQGHERLGKFTLRSSRGYCIEPSL